MLIKLELLRYRMVKKNYDTMLSRFHPIPERNGRTDGRRDRQTDRFAISISRVSMLMRDKNRIRTTCACLAVASEQEICRNSMPSSLRHQI